MDKLKMCFLEVKENECDQKKCPAVNRVRWDAATSRSGVVFNHPSSTNIECLSSFCFLIIPAKNNPHCLGPIDHPIEADSSSAVE